jgi:hypothetical protein
MASLRRMNTLKTLKISRKELICSHNRVLPTKMNGRNGRAKLTICHAHIPSEIILPEYLNLYAKSVCGKYAANVVEYNASLSSISTCLDEMVIPPLDVQSNILEQLHCMAMTTDIRNFVGPLMKLMIKDDNAQLKELFNAILSYNMSIDVIKNIT